MRYFLLLLLIFCFGCSSTLGEHVHSDYDGSVIKNRDFTDCEIAKRYTEVYAAYVYSYKKDRDFTDCDGYSMWCREVGDLNFCICHNASEGHNVLMDLIQDKTK